MLMAAEKAELRKETKIRRSRNLAKKIDRFISAQQMYLYWDKGHFVHMSRRLQRRLGYLASDIKGKDIKFFLASEDEARLDLNGKRIIQRLALRTKDGSIAYFEAVVGREDSLTIGFLSDITERILREDFLFAQLQVDDLSNVFNRRGFFSAARMRLDMAERDGIPLILLTSDIDQFGMFNKKVGLPVADLVIQVVANTFKEVFSRKSDIIGRPHGDTFMVLGEAKGFSLEKMEREFKGTLDRIWAPSLKDHTKIDVVFPVSLTFGMSYFNPANPVTLDQLIDWADEEMRRRKKT